MSTDAVAMGNSSVRNRAALCHATSNRHRLALLLATVLSSGAHAAWLTNGSARVDSVYEDNVYLSSDNQDSAIVTTANLQGEIRQVTETSNVSAIAGLKYLNYGQVGNLSDNDEEFGSLRSWWRSERLRWGVTGTFRRDLLLSTVGYIGPVDLATGAAGDPGAGVDTTGDGVSDGTIDQGAVEVQVRRNRTQVNPFVGYELSERTSASLQYGYNRTDYSNEQGSFLQDSQANRASVQVVHRFSERDSMRGSLGAAKFNPETGSSTNTYDLTTGWEHRFSELAGASVDVGASRTERDGNGDTGALFRARGYRRTEVGSFFAQVERRLYPGTNGELVETDRMIFGLKRSLSERMEISVTGDGYKTSSTGTNLSAVDYRDYATVGPELRWSLSPELSVGATYQFTWADRQGDQGTAAGNSVGVFVSYQPRREL